MHANQQDRAMRSFFMHKKNPQWMRVQKEEIFVCVGLCQIDTAYFVAVIKVAAKAQTTDRSRAIIGNGILIIPSR